MDIREVIKMVNQMQADGVIERYAVGGAVGATFYLEPVATLDVDIFIAFQPEEGSLIVSPKPIFDYLKARGGTMEGNTSSLVVGRFNSSRPPDRWGRRLSRRPWNPMSMARLRAYSLPNTSPPSRSRPRRAKDKARLLQFIEAGALDAARFQAILVRHGLVHAWQKFERQFLSDTP